MDKEEIKEALLEEIRDLWSSSGDKGDVLDILEDWVNENIYQSKNKEEMKNAHNSRRSSGSVHSS